MINPDSVTVPDSPRARPGALGFRASADSTVSVVTRANLDLGSLKRKAEADPQGFVNTLSELVEARAEFTMSRKRGETPPEWCRVARHFSFDGIADLCGMRHALDEVGPLSVRDPDLKKRGAMVQTGAFPLAANALVVAGLNDAYMDVEPIEDRLVQTRSTNAPLTAFAGVLTTAAVLDETAVPEGTDFPMIGAKEEEFWCSHLRRGFQTTLSQELFEQNNVAGIEDRLTNLARLARRKRRWQILKRITDNNGSAATPAEPYVLHGPGASTGRALFVTANTAPLTRLPSTGNRITNNALVDVSDLEACRLRLAAMTDSDGHRIEVPDSELVLLVPQALRYTAWQIVTSVTEPGVFGAMNFYGPNGAAGPGQRGLVSSSFLDDLSTTAWYYGAPRMQFRMVEKLPLEVATFGGPGTEPFVSSRTALRVRVAWDFEVCALDYVYWLQCLDGTTPPTAQ